MKPNMIYLDFETSGLDPSRHAILQAAWIIEQDGEVISERVIDICPESDADMCLAALECNNFSLERIKAGKSVGYFLEAFRADGLQISHPRICGHNIQFDIGFLMAAIKKHHDNLTLYFDFKKAVDTVSIARFLDYQGLISLPDYKLVTLCKHFGIQIKAHDALEDIRATRQLFYRLYSLQTGKNK